MASQIQRRPPRTDATWSCRLRARLRLALISLADGQVYRTGASPASGSRTRPHAAARPQTTTSAERAARIVTPSSPRATAAARMIGGRCVTTKPARSRRSSRGFAYDLPMISSLWTCLGRTGSAVHVTVPRYVGEKQRLPWMHLTLAVSCARADRPASRQVERHTRFSTRPSVLRVCPRWTSLPPNNRPASTSR
jgi:hypothetical protein